MGGGEILGLGFTVLIGTAIVCVINYAAAALITGAAKVLANISATLAQSNNGSAQ